VHRIKTAWLAALVCAPLLAADAEKGRFTKDSLGKLPAGWKSAKTGKGEGSVWKVVKDETTPSKAGYALAQTAAGPGPLFNLCVAEEPRLKDVDLKVAFKAVKGEEDQGGGLVWRYQDANNYYVARMNPLEDNYRLYHVVAGVRKQIAGKEGVKVKVNTWHTLRVTMKGEQITCWLDGKKLIEAKDETFTKAGKVGLWTKADAQSHFDDFKASEPGR
jgi:hypothetical protein